MKRKGYKKKTGSSSTGFSVSPLFFSCSLSSGFLSVLLGRSHTWCERRVSRPPSFPSSVPASCHTPSPWAFWPPASWKPPAPRAGADRRHSPRGSTDFICKRRGARQAGAGREGPRGPFAGPPRPRRRPPPPATRWRTGRCRAACRGSACRTTCRWPRPTGRRSSRPCRRPAAP